MILTFLLTIFYYFFLFIVNLLPTSSGFPPEFINYFSTVFGYLYNFDSVLPVSTIVKVVGVALIFHGGIMAWRIINYIIRLIRG